MGGKGKGGRSRFQPERGGMMKQVQQLQAQMMQVQKELAEETVSVSVGGGAVEVLIDGQQTVRRVTIHPDVVDPEDVEMLQDLIAAAVNEAMAKSRQLAEQLADVLGIVTLERAAFIQAARAERAVDQLDMATQPLEQPQHSPHTNLPAHLTRLIGRDQEVTAGDED